MNHKRIRDLASRAVRLSAEDGKITGFGILDQHEKSIVDNLDFLYWLVHLAEIDEREACAKVCDSLSKDHGRFHPDDIEWGRGIMNGAEMCSATIRARGKT